MKVFNFKRKCFSESQRIIFLTSYQHWEMRDNIFEVHIKRHLDGRLCFFLYDYLQLGGIYTAPVSIFPIDDVNTLYYKKDGLSPRHKIDFLADYEYNEIWENIF